MFLPSPLQISVEGHYHTFDAYAGVMRLLTSLEQGIRIDERDYDSHGFIDYWHKEMMGQGTGLILETLRLKIKEITGLEPINVRYES